MHAAAGRAPVKAGVKGKAEVQAKTFCVGGTRVLLSCRIRERTLETENIVWDYGEYINELHDELDEILKNRKG